MMSRAAKIMENLDEGKYSAWMKETLNGGVVQLREAMRAIEKRMGEIMDPAHMESPYPASKDDHTKLGECKGKIKECLGMMMDVKETLDKAKYMDYAEPNQGDVKPNDDSNMANNENE